MRRYNVYNLKVVMVNNSDSSRYLICKYSKLTGTYIEIITNSKINIKDIANVEPLSNYYSALKEGDYTTRKVLMLNKTELILKYVDINSGEKKREVENKAVTVDSESSLEPKTNIDVNSVLDKATIDFFPKDGVWGSHCFDRPSELVKCNLPCHLRDDIWLAKMLMKDQNLSYMSFQKILDYVKKSEFFNQKRHEYEMEIVKWQINWMRSGGGNWICDYYYGGDFCFLTPVCDLGFRKGVVDTLSSIGMNIDAIEEGLERNADLWRDSFMSRAFTNEYDPVFFMSKLQVEPADPEHREKWLKMRKYEYYRRHKKSVDTYGVVESDMKISVEESLELKKYLEQKHQERMLHIEEVKNANYGTSGQLRILRK